MKTCFFFLGFSFFLLWNLSATEEKFFRVELHEKFFSAEYSPEFFERYVALLGKDFRLVERPPRNLCLRRNFYLCSRRGMVSSGWESGSVTGGDFTVGKHNVKLPCSVVADVKTVPFADGIAWVLFEVRITGPVRVTYQYGVAVKQVIRDGRYTLGITGEVRGFPASCLLISAGKGEE